MRTYAEVVNRQGLEEQWPFMRYVSNVPGVQRYHLSFYGFRNVIMARLGLCEYMSPLAVYALSFK